MNVGIRKPVASEDTLSQPVDAIRLAFEVLLPGGDGLDWSRIAAELASADADLERCRHMLACGTAALTSRFLAGESAGRLVRDRARLVDLVITAAWHQSAAPALPDTALVAVGGYGRGELHPHSDVDLLVLLPNRGHRKARNPVAGFLALLWDVGLEVGHSARTVRECQEQARADITVATTLMESRCLAGPKTLCNRMQEAVGPSQIWSSRSFFEAKLKEQQARHAGYHDTAYNLEPNVKGSPGGLRDIQMIIWVAHRHFGTGDLEDLVQHGFLTPGQHLLIEQCREFLWKIRFALHTLTGRREDRLLFDYQTKLAALFGYEDGLYMLAVEQLMQRYYRTVMDLSRLNEMLLQLFQEAILMNPNVTPQPVNEHFQVKNGFLQITSEDVFAINSSALLELFVLLQQKPDLKGVSAYTMTAIKRNLHLIDDEFRRDPANHQLFLKILRAPAGVTHELRRMNLYGVLGRYLPAFGRIVGRMQYDLFHAYTVDAHTLFVVSNLRRFALERFNHEFPRCSEIMQSLPTPEIVYLAGLFHDIAKGRGGDHSELGAVEAEAFCLEHGMSRYDARVVAWLVRHHLLLSITAQKKDISDAAVIREFAQSVGDELHLDYLYVLTVADVRATNPNLWNSWRAQLFEELHALARQALRRGLENPIDKDELLKQRKSEARRLLSGSLESAAIDEVWHGLSEDYFLRCKTAEIASHTELLADPANRRRETLVDVRDQASGGGTTVFIFAPQSRYTFALATAVLDELGINIADARVIPLRKGRTLSTFVILEPNGAPLSEPERLAQIERRLIQAIGQPDDAQLTVTRRAPRQVRMFSTSTLVSFAPDTSNNRTVMEIVTGDRPGLLSEVGKILRDRRIAIQTAKIVTVGERAEDVFYITDQVGQPLDSGMCSELKRVLTDSLRSTD
jgi:[protein-PII] uridylyltransferase